MKPAPTSWSAVFDDASKYKGKVTAYDSPIYIADAALYLMQHQPDLGIKDPYALDKNQLDAAVDLLKKQRVNVSEYWRDYTKEVSAFKAGSTVIGTTWQVIANIATEDAPVKAVFPDTGLHRLVGHLDGRGQVRPPQLCVHVGELRRLPEGQRPGGGVLR